MTDSDRTRWALRFALAASVTATLIPSGCRKAEPEEVVNAGARPNTSAGGAASSPDETGGESSEASGGESSGVGEGGSVGAGGAAPERPDASVTEDGGKVTPEPEPKGCVVPIVATDEPFSKAKLLESAADCAIGRYCVFSSKAKALATAAAAYAGDRSVKNRDATRAAWKDAMTTWQEAEQFRFGPMAQSKSPGGQDLRDIIYSWPLAARCKVDEQTLSRFYQSKDFTAGPTKSLVSGRSLAALEYLAFYEATDNGCNAFSTVNASGAWKSLAADEIRARRAAYASAIANDVSAHAETLLNAWLESGENFRKTFSSAGPGNSTYPAQQDALNALNEGLFYLENDVKDLKLALPLGLSPDCPSGSCPEAAEAPYARVSVSNLKQNLAGFRRLFQGCGQDNAGLGFDDWLENEGHAELSGRILTALSAAEAKVAALDEPIGDLVLSDPARVRAAYDAVKAVTDPLKGELITVLNLELPKATEGDND